MKKQDVVAYVNNIYKSVPIRRLQKVFQEADLVPISSVAERLTNHEWIKDEDLQNVTGLGFCELNRYFDLDRRAEWWSIVGKTEEERRREGQRITCRFRMRQDELRYGDYTKRRSLDGRSFGTIESMVLDHARWYLDKVGVNIKLIAASVYGSRFKYGLYSVSSDLDVVLLYSGNVGEDYLFNLLHEEKYYIDGMLVDINPLCGGFADLCFYMDEAEKYLVERARGSDAKAINII